MKIETASCSKNTRISRAGTYVWNHDALRLLSHFAAIETFYLCSLLARRS
jgi:hypothetical protein